MQTRTAVEAPPAAPALDASIAATLPPVFVGETPEKRTEHEWPGNLFVILSYVAAVGLAAGAVGGVGWAVISGSVSPAVWAVGAGVGAALQWRLAKAVEHFSRWGWFGAMAELGTAAAIKAYALTTGDIAGPLCGIAIDLLWMRYFWDRRGDFDVDLGG